jgi:hypothetical protein
MAKHMDLRIYMGSPRPRAARWLANRATEEVALCPSLRPEGTGRPPNTLLYI